MKETVPVFSICYQCAVTWDDITHYTVLLSLAYY